MKTKLLVLVTVSILLLGVFAGTAGATTNNQKWTQFKDDNITLHFLSENTPPTLAIKSKINDFTAKTGIKVKITQTRLADVVSKTLLDFSAGAGDIELIYADPYQIIAPLAGHFADMRKFIDDPTLPELPKGLDDFTETGLHAGGYMLDKNKLLGIPYDAPTMIWFYRKDIFKKYKDQFMEDMGYDWTPGPNITWQQYYEIAKWINENVDEVKYGTGQQALMYDSLQCDFSNVLAAFGGSYFSKSNVGLWGTDLPGECTLDQPEAIKAAKFYNNLVHIAAPGSTSWDWSGVAEAFSSGEIAMMPEWHEFASSLEDPNTSKVAGKVGYAILPRGPNGSKNIWGGTNISINSYAPEKEQKAAWLFIVWATSPEVQKDLLLDGSTPTRNSVYNDPEVKQWIKEKKSPIMASLTTVKKAWQPENIYLRPKTPSWLQVDTVVYTELSKMLAGKKSPEQAMQDAKKQIDDITGWSDIANK